MKKAGEKTRSFAVHIAFILFIVLSIYFIARDVPTLTGNAVIDTSTAKSKLENALSSSATLSQISSASICVIINDAEQPLTLQAVMSDTGWTVTETTGDCTGETGEDLIVQFADYDSFSKIMDSPSPRNIANGVKNQDFEILPSKNIELGGNVVCDASFASNFCGALKQMAGEEDLIEADLSCCIGELSGSQRKLLEQHIQDTGLTDETGVLEQPTGIMGMSTTMIFSLGGGALILLIAIVIVVAGSKGKGIKSPKAAAAIPSQSPIPQMPAMAPTVSSYQPPAESPQVTELRSYVTQVMSQGYAPDEIRMHLLQIGWDEKTADNVIGEAYNTLSQNN
jgi:hypothetical protein